MCIVLDTVLRTNFLYPIMQRLTAWYINHLDLSKIEEGMFQFHKN